MRRRPFGMTLLELLAAVIVLSIVASAGTSIVRETSSAGDAWREKIRFAEIIERWRAEMNVRTEENRFDEWSVTGSGGMHWRITAINEPIEPGDEDGTRALRVALRGYSMERAPSSSAQRSTVVFHRIVVPANDVDGAGEVMP